MTRKRFYVPKSESIRDYQIKERRPAWLILECDWEGADSNQILSPK